jgi:hypothetical protein
VSSGPEGPYDYKALEIYYGKRPHLVFARVLQLFGFAAWFLLEEVFSVNPAVKSPRGRAVRSVRRPADV